MAFSFLYDYNEEVKLKSNLSHMSEYFLRPKVINPNKPIHPESHFTKMIERADVKEDIILASRNLAAYLKTEKIPNVMFLDKSSRQGYLGLKGAWKKDYPGDKEPNIYFINPQPLSDADDFPVLAEEFWKKYQNLSPAEPILLYDVCIHTGSTAKLIKDFFNYLGFTDVRLAITSVADNVSEEAKSILDLVCLPNRASLGCHPYGNPAYLKDTGSLVSALNSEKRAAGATERQKIKEVFK